MAGLNDRRRLGTESGRIRREARAIARAGGNPNELLNRAAQAKLGEGSAISSSEENIAFEQEKRRMQSGLMEEKRRATLGGDSAQKFNADIDRSALVKTDPAARQRAYDRGATLGMSREDIDKRAGTLQGTTPPSIGSSPRPTLQGPPASAKPGLIDGKPARSVLDSLREPDTEPGNLADLKTRDAKDRAAAVTAARTESAGETSTTRKDVVGRINAERTAKGLQPFGDDIYKDMTAQEVAEGERGRELSRAAVTPLQKSLADARTRFAPPPVEEPDLLVRPLFNTTEDERQRAREDASEMVKEKARQDGASLLAARPRSLGGALLQDMESVRDSTNQVVSGVMRGVRGQLNRESEAFPKIGSAAKRKLGDTSSAAGKSLLSRVPGATGSYLRDRFVQPR